MRTEKEIKDRIEEILCEEWLSRYLDQERAILIKYAILGVLRWVLE